ncbi:MAG: hypothetical protein HOP18_13970 [Deltaproteobacteria bacterium]|nr:hypothetical protein [Deltaproteobacteria bacterium]
MRTATIVSALVGLSLTSLIAGTSPALAEEFVCTGTVGAVTLDNVLVPAARTCTLNGTRIQGSIVVKTGATLSASAVRVNGNIQAEGARAVFLNPASVVGGSVQLEQGGSARVDRVHIVGDLQLESNRGFLSAMTNRVGGNVQIFQNTGGVTLLNNRIAQNLQCKANRPAPTGSGNRAGSKEDQCAAL